MSEWLESRTCAECGKQFEVLYPQLWRYKRGFDSHYYYLCSWSCLRAFDKRKEENKMDRIEVAKILLDEIAAGRHPIAKLKELGYMNPAQAYTDIKHYLRKHPEHGLELPNLVPQRGKKKPETPEGNAKPAPAKKMITDPDVEAKIPDELVCTPVSPPIEYRITGISTTAGEFRYDERHGYIDWDPLDNPDTVSLKVEEWREFVKIWPHVLKVLKVPEVEE